MMKKNIILLGAPGSGKGTQSALLVKNCGLSHVSTGNLLREEIEKKSELGLRVQAVMESGNLVSDELVTELLRAKLDLNQNAYIFDGYPRNMAQALRLEELLEGHEYLVFNLSIDLNKMVNRLTNRRSTKDGKHIYNLVTNPPKKEGVCDITGQPLVQREDDREEVIKERFEVFRRSTEDLLKYYSEKGRLVNIDADREVEVVHKNIVEKIC